MKTLLVLTLLITALLKRSLFWLAMVQQKEYRLDRMQLFLASREGKAEVWKLLPSKSWLAVKFWKRPHWTPRLIVVAMTWVCLAGLILSGGIWLISSWSADSFWFSLILIIGLIIAIYLATPGLVMVALLPTVAISVLVTARVSRQAQVLVKKHRPLVIGITGSYGKTSTKQLLAHVLSTKFSVYATPSSFNTRYSVAHSIVTDYQGEEVMIIEYGAYKMGEIAKLCQVVPPKLAVITGITAQHLGIFGDLESIIAAKSELTRALPADGVVFYNGADNQTHQVASAFAGIKYAYNDPEHLQIQSAGLTADGRVELVLDGVVVKTQLVGLHYLSSLEAVLAVGEHLGVPRSQIIARLMSFQPTTNFTQIYDMGQNRHLLDDGLTSNPAGFQAMTELAKSLSGQPKILIFGGIIDLADQSVTIHRQLAEISAPVFDQIWYFNPEGRAEFLAVKKNWVLTQRSEILAAVTNLPAGSLLVIEGKIPTWLNQPVTQLKRRT